MATSIPERAAFVRGGILYIQDGAGGANPLPVEDCSANDCFIYHLSWSSGGDRLLYYFGSYEATIPQQIRIADSTGVTQTLTENAAYVQPAGWSWDGSAIVYRTDTDRYAEAADGPAQRIQEVWTTTIDDVGTLGEPQLRGEVTFGEGCGGGGRSESANVYEREGGFAYGYLSGITLWTPADILLYSDNCTTSGVSRFNLANNSVLESYPGNLRSLSLNSDGDAWVAINGDNQIVIGTPGSLDFTVVPSAGVPELVFYDKVTGTLYYTTLEITGGIDLVEEASTTLDPSIMIFPYFDTTEASLNALVVETGEESELYSGDGYAYARVHERRDGSIGFSRVEDNSELQAAVESEALTAENWQSFMPTADVLTVVPGGEALVLLANVKQYTPATD